jgi:hypothetical protein
MTTRRVAALGIAVTALLVIAGIASHGRPLSAHKGSGPTPVFFDYVFTTIVVIGLGMLAVVIYSFMQAPKGEFRPPNRRFQFLTTFAMLVAAGLLGVLFTRTGFTKRLHQLAQKSAQAQPAGSANPNSRKHNAAARGARIRWDEVALVALLVGGAGAMLIASRRRRALRRPWRERRQEAVAMTLDESLDDLRSEPDLRRAIIAAYARMERALALAGLPRSPAEAPFEYVERALVSLDASSSSARRLTALFEWAKFSHHEPDAEMRDESIAALEAVRDDLRRPQELAA